MNDAPDISTFTIPFSTLTRILAVHKAASDRETHSTLLCGVLLRPATVDTHPGPCVAIVATDGKILIEEVWPTSDPLPHDLVISQTSVKLLSAWHKGLVKILKAKGWDVGVIAKLEGGKLTLEDPLVGSVPLALVDGVYPYYLNALQTSYQSNPFKGSEKATTCLGAGYMARLEDLWGAQGIVMTFGRGVFISPLTPDRNAISQRGLLMPMIIPN